MNPREAPSRRPTRGARKPSPRHFAQVTAATAAVAIAAAACGGPSGTPPTSAAPKATATTTAAPSAGSATTLSAPSTPSTPSTVWLCRPGVSPDPCAPNLDTSVVSGTGASTLQHVASAPRPAIDCFYVYPTVSAQKTVNSDLTIDPAEIAVANAQAAQFSQVCRVWAPMYNQVTLSGLFSGGLALQHRALAYGSLLSAWRDYLAHDNHGRRVVFIGHSQGAAVLIRLLQSEIDPNAALRHKMVSAILLGGNVTVPVGRDVGGTFAHIPACKTAGQTGCVIAYSSFLDPPPTNSLFGRPGTGVSLLSGQQQTANLEVLCVNPASLSGGSGALLPVFGAPAGSGVGQAGQGRFVEYPGLYTAACTSSGGATWLQVNVVGQAGDQRPVVNQPLGPTWGLHIVDVNIALGNLVGVVRAEAKSIH